MRPGSGKQPKTLGKRRTPFSLPSARRLGSDLQSELGGLFYEMVIRDHVVMEVLMPRAAEMQRIDAELAAVRRVLESGETSVGGQCPACGAVYARAAAFCAQCATPLTPA